LALKLGALPRSGGAAALVASCAGNDALDVSAVCVCLCVLWAFTRTYTHTHTYTLSQAHTNPPRHI
jgi:hypothetical protein